MLYVPTWTRVRRRTAAAAAIVPESDAGRARAEVADQSSAAASPSPAEQRPVTAVRGREPVRMMSGCGRADGDRLLAIISPRRRAGTNNWIMYNH